MAPAIKTSALTDQDKQRSMRCAIIASMTTTTAAACTTGTVLQLAAMKLGAAELFLGVLHFCIWAPSVSRIFTMMTIERVGKQKVMLRWFVISLACFTPLLLLPIVANIWAPRACLALILTVTLTATAANYMGNTGWFPFLQDIVPEEITGRFFARLRTAWQSSLMATSLAIAWFLGVSQGQYAPWWKFGVIFAVGLLALLTRIIVLRPISENPPDPNVSPVHPFQRFAEVFGNKKLRRLAAYMVSYVTASMITVPFKIKLLKDLGYSDGYIVAATAAISLGAIISLKSWGKLADRFGNRAIFSISHVGMIVIIMLWILVEKSAFSTVFVFVLFFTESIFNSGNGIALTRYILHAIPQAQQNQINIVNLIIALCAAVGPLIGGLFLHLTSSWRLHSGAVDLNNYHMLFLATAILFVVPHTLRRRLGLKKETPTTQVLSFITQSVRHGLGPIAHLTKRSDSDS